MVTKKYLRGKNRNNRVNVFWKRRWRAVGYLMYVVKGKHQSKEMSIMPLERRVVFFGLHPVENMRCVNNMKVVAQGYMSKQRAGKDNKHSTLFNVVIGETLNHK